jgi:uncharacterized protein (DUF2336 family)
LFVPSASFHQITVEDRLPKSDRLFRAAISGYCSLTRPTGRDAAQLDDLALPLLPLVSEESKRFAAAALSESLPAPPALLRRLADYPVAVSAPLLVRSRALADIDLIGLIGRNGVAHARAIGRRPALNPNIAALVRALGVAPEPEARIVPETTIAKPVDEAPPSTAGALAEETRERLRAMMLPSTETAYAMHTRHHARIDWTTAHAAYPRMVATGLSGVAALFQTAIADAFDLTFDRACQIVEDRTSLPVALKAAGLSAAEAFFVTALAFPPRFGNTAAIRAFVEDYRRLDMDESRRLVAGWRDDQSRAQPEAEIPQPANTDDHPRDWAELLLKAS